VSWFAIALLAAGVAVVVAAEWPRLDERLGPKAFRRRSRTKRKANLKVVQGGNEPDDFAASVQRDLDKLPTYDPRR